MSDRNRETLEEYEVIVYSVHAQLFRVRARPDDPEDAIARVNNDEEHYTGPVVLQHDLPEDKWKVRGREDGKDADHRGS